MVEYKIKKMITLRQFEILNDVLMEIEESRVYEGDDYEILEQLQDMFSYSKYCELKKEFEGDV